MVSTMMVHLMGIATLSSILVIVIIHTSMITETMITNNIRNILNDIAETLSLQIIYAINSETNMSITLEYPSLISTDRTYNVYIGTGRELNKKFSWLNLQPDNTLYVLLIEPRSNIYAFRPICSQNISKYTVLLEKDPMLFASTTLTRLNVTFFNNTIKISIHREGVVVH